MTTEEIASRISAEKASLKAEMAAEGRLYEPGTFPNDWSFAQRAYPYEEVNHEQMTEAMADGYALRLSATRSDRAAWQERGPSNIGARVTDLAFDPTDPDIIYAAMASGGLFKTADGGSTWDPIFDDQPVLTIGDMAVDPDDPDVIYVGTGESNATSSSWFGAGIFKSTDGGSTWSHIGLEETRYTGRIVIDPRNTDRVWVAATGTLFGTNPDRGVYRSTDAGDSWTQVFALTDSTAAIDLAINPDHPDTVYVAMWERVRRRTYRRSGGPSSGIYRSTDGGDTWSELTSGLPSGSGVGRIGISVCESDPSVIYAMYVDDPGYFDGLFKSTDGGDTWTQTNDGALSNLTRSFGWYFGQVRVDPDNPDRVFALGVPFYRSQNGGASWSEVGYDNHVDHHALEFDPTDATRIFEGNDGGIYVSTDSGSSWTKLYDQPTNQFYAIEIDYQHPERLYGGTQDNGTLRTPTGATDDWERIFGGDGFYTIVDPTDPNTIYCEYQWGNAYKSTDFGNYWSWALNGVNGGDRRNWSSPIVMDPSDAQTLYFGTYRLWRTTDGASWWSAISTDLTNGNQGSYGTITTIAVSSGDPDVIYVGTDDSNVWVTENGGGTWSNISGTLPNRWVTRVAVDHNDASVAYVTFSGLRWDEEIAHLYRTDDFGTTWTDISGNLPDAPFNVVAVDPDLPSALYIGTDVGCFFTKDLGANWEVLGTGLPPAPVFDLKIHQPTRTLVAGTHGRSMYSIDLNDVTGVDDGIAEAKTIAGFASFPNPFNPSTTVVYSLSRPAGVSITVHDLAGRCVRTVESGYREAGQHEAHWDGRNDQGRAVSSGTYFMKLEANGEAVTRKVSLVK
jgi:photosystem II stability/assembly factor-like uncharacterized protein